MSRSYWLPIIALGGWLVTTLGWSADQPKNPSGTTQAAQSTPSATPDHTGALLPETPQTDEQPTVGPNPDEEAKQLARDDLSAQLRMARASEELLTLTGEQVIQSSRAVFWTILGTIGTIIAALATAYAAKAASAAAKAAEASVEVARDAAKQELRAYITVGTGACVPQDRSTGWRYEIRPVVANTGQTPAQKVGVYCKVGIFPFPLPDDVDLSVPSDLLVRAGTVGPKQQYYARAWLEDMIDEAEEEKIKGGADRRLYVYGTIFYEDTFGEPRYTNFCQFSMWDKSGNHHGMNTQRHNDSN